MTITLLPKHGPLILAAALLLLISNCATSLALAEGSTSADVLLGPADSPAAQGPTSVNDDFTNLGINGRTAAAPGTTTVGPGAATFNNTVQN